MDIDTVSIGRYLACAIRNNTRTEHTFIAHTTFACTIHTYFKWNTKDVSFFNAFMEEDSITSVGFLYYIRENVVGV